MENNNSIIKNYLIKIIYTKNDTIGVMEVRANSDNKDEIIANTVNDIFINKKPEDIIIEEVCRYKVF